jgi:hypothetical protein
LKNYRFRLKDQFLRRPKPVKVSHYEAPKY